MATYERTTGKGRRLKKLEQMPKRFIHVSHGPVKGPNGYVWVKNPKPYVKELVNEN